MYAIGEIILVVLGILIALEINNWNEEQISLIREKEYVRSIYQDLKNDILNIDANRERLEIQYDTGIEVLTALEHKTEVPLDSVKVALNLGWHLTEVIPVERAENTWDGLKVQGLEIHTLKDPVAGLLNRFYAEYDAQIDRFNQLPRKVRLDLRELTGLCHDAEGIRVVNKNGFGSYGATAYGRQCILSIKKAPNLVGTIALSSIVHIKIYKDLKHSAETLVSEMEQQFDFL